MQKEFGCIAAGDAFAHVYIWTLTAAVPTHERTRRHVPPTALCLHGHTGSIHRSGTQLPLFFFWLHGATCVLAEFRQQSRGLRAELTVHAPRHILHASYSVALRTAAIGTAVGLSPLLPWPSRIRWSCDGRAHAHGRSGWHGAVTAACSHPAQMTAASAYGHARMERTPQPSLCRCCGATLLASGTLPFTQMAYWPPLARTAAAGAAGTQTCLPHKTVV